MKFRLLLMIPLVAISLQTLAQNIEIDKKTGFVKVDGKDAFFLTPKNKVLFSSDYSLKNLREEELAYVKQEQVEELNTYTNKYEKVQMYRFTFVQTGNSCLVKANNSFNTSKAISRIVAAAGLIKDNAISLEAERKFIVMNKGTFLKDPNADNNKVVVNVNGGGNSPSRSAGPAEISLKENKVYNNGELVATFKRSADGGNTLIQVYNADGSKVAEARHPDANENEDWTVKLVNEGKTLTLLYSPVAPLEKLFKYLAEKSYL